MDLFSLRISCPKPNANQPQRARNVQGKLTIWVRTSQSGSHKPPFGNCLFLMFVLIGAQWLPMAANSREVIAFCGSAHVIFCSTLAVPTSLVALFHGSEGSLSATCSQHSIPSAS